MVITVQSLSTIRGQIFIITVCVILEANVNEMLLISANVLKRRKILSTF